MSHDFYVIFKFSYQKFGCNIPNFQVFMFCMQTFMKFSKLVILSLDFQSKNLKMA